MSKNLPVFVFHFSEGFHYFEEATITSAENITVASGETIYCGVPPAIFFPKGHPNNKISWKKVVNLYFHKIGEPFCRASPIDATFVSRARKQQILIERGFYQIVDDVKAKNSEMLMKGIPRYIGSSDVLPNEKIITHPVTQKQIVCLDITDMDFCRADYGNALMIDEIAEFHKASKHANAISKMQGYLITICATVFAIYFVRLGGLDTIAMIIGALKG